jgi:hypothetical protein
VFQSSAFVFELFQPLHFTQLHAAVLGLPAVIGLLGDPVRTTQIGDLPARLLSLTMARICSSVNLLRFIDPPVNGGPYSMRSGLEGAGHRSYCLRLNDLQQVSTREIRLNFSCLVDYRLEFASHLWR